jgi:glycine/D-amino acid oxidase-like deaminating enzyme
MTAADRIVVIGAGAIGLATALQLARAGRKVTIIDAAAAGSGTSGTTFSWLNANDKAPRTYFELNRAGLAEYRRVSAAGDGGEWLRLTGHIEWADSDETAAALELRTQRMRNWGYPVASLTALEATRLEPDIRVPANAEIRSWPEEGHIVPALFIDALEGRATAAGVTLSTHRAVVGFDRRGDMLTAAILADGTKVSAGTFVACAGRWTGKLVGHAGAHVPMIEMTQGSRSLGLLGYTAPVATQVGRVISSPGVNVRPDTPGRYVLQGNDLDRLAVPGGVPASDGREASEILRRGNAILRRFDGAELDALRVGYRSIPADGITVAGWAPGVEGLYVLATHSGMTLALVLARLATNEITNAVEEAALAPFRVTRFAQPATAGTRG